MESFAVAYGLTPREAKEQWDQLCIQDQRIFIQMQRVSHSDIIKGNYVEEGKKMSVKVEDVPPPPVLERQNAELPQSPWLAHLKAFRESHPDIKGKQVFSEAAKTYTSSRPPKERTSPIKPKPFYAFLRIYRKKHPRVSRATTKFEARAVWRQLSKEERLEFIKEESKDN